MPTDQTAPPITSLIQFGAPCWVLRRPDGTDIGSDLDTDLDRRHLDTEAQARQVIAEECAEVEGALPTPVELTDRCWRVACGRCGEELDCDEFAVQHFATEADARSLAGEGGWVAGSDGELYEYGCAPAEDSDA